MDTLKKKYKEVLKFNKENKLLIITLGVAIISIVLVLIAYKFAEDNIDYASDTVQAFIEGKSYIIDEEGNINCITLILNNIFACILPIGIGIIPFVFSPVLSIIVNSALIGIVLGFINNIGDAPLMNYILAGLLPHGIFEFPAMLYSFSLGILLCLEISKACLKKNKQPIKKTLLNILWSFLLIILPLLIVAGIIEAYITPLIMEKVIQ